MSKKVYIKERGVSEVVGTILILAITVVLFATIFAYVQHVPPPQKTAEMIIQSSFNVSGNYTFVQLTDLSGSEFSSNFTYLDIFYNGSASFFTLYNIIHKGTFGPGDSFILNLSKYGIYPSNLSNLQMIIFSKQYNQILWHMGGFQFSGIYILNAYASPLPISPNSYFTIVATVYSPYSSTYVNITRLLGNAVNIPYSSLISSNGEYKEYLFNVKAPSSLNVYSEYAIITAEAKNHISTYNLSLYSTTAQSPDVFIENITFQTLRPTHGSSDSMEIIVRDNSAIAATFNIYVDDRYPNNGSIIPISNSLGNSNVSGITVVSGNFSVGGYSTDTIYLVWYNVGGNGPGAGNNEIIADTVNIRGVNGISQIPNPPAVSYSVYVEPKILLVNAQGVYSGTSEDISEYYKIMLEYSDYSYSYINVMNNQYVYLNGYDLVIWFIGMNSYGLSSSQLNILSQFYENGGKLFIIAPNDPALEYTFDSKIPNINMTITSTASSAMNISQISKLYLTNQQNMNEYVSSTGIIFQISNYFPGSENLTYMNYHGTYYATSCFASYSSNGHITGRAVILGFEFARLPVYQQDYIGNKILMWLSNITYMPGYQLALTDIIPSTYTPLFSQQVNISFYINNLSPKNLSTQLEVLLNGNFYNLYSIPNIPKDGGFTIFNITWNASPPGITVISGIVDPFHVIPQMNYALDVESSLINTTIFTQYSVMILKVQKNLNNVQGTEQLNSTLNSLNIKYHWYLYNPSSSLNYTQLFKRFNAVIIDSDYSISSGLSAGSFNKLANAIQSYLNLGTTSSSGLYSIAFIGNGTYYLFNYIPNLNQFASFSGSQATLSSQISGLYNIYGNNNSLASNSIFGEYFTNSIGFLISPPGNGRQQFYSISYSNNLIPVLSSEWNGHGYILGAIGNIQGFKYFVGDFGLSQIQGIIQLHTYQYSPNNYVTDSEEYLMLMMMGYFNYTEMKVIPDVLASTITFSSNILMINRYYVVSSEILNLGNKGGSVEVEAFDGSGLFNTETVYLPPLSIVPVQFIWDPQFAGTPQNPRDIRIVVSFIAGSYLRSLSFLQEGIATTPVYVFYDNLSTGENWHSYDVVWAWEGVNPYSDSNYLYSAQPYSVEGIAGIEGYSYGDGYQISGSDLFSYIGDAWGIFPNGISGGYAIGTSYDYVSSYYGSWYDYGYSVLETVDLSVHNAEYAYLEFDALYKLAIGGEGVDVFISPAGQSQWQWISPIQGYPSNVNYGPLNWYSLSGNSYNFYYPQNGGDLLPAFTTVSGGENFQWEHYVFNISGYTQDSSVQIMFVLILDNNYYMNVYGNDFFMMDNIKVVENGTLLGSGSTSGDMWNRQYSNGVWYYYSSTIYPDEIDNVVSVPISLTNLANATLDFETQYSIYVRFANAADPTDVPNGFRLYVGYLSSNGKIIWNQLDTRWAGEAGLLDGQWYDAASVYSAYYQGVYAFHQTGNDISLTGYIGLTIYLKFEVNGNNPNDFDSTFGSEYGINGISSPGSSYNNWAAFTDVVITGISYADLITVNNYW